MSSPPKKARKSNSGNSVANTSVANVPIVKEESPDENTAADDDVIDPASMYEDEEGIVFQFCHTYKCLYSVYFD